MDSLDGIEDYVIILEDDESLSDRVTIQAVTLPSNLEKIANKLRTEARVQLPVLVSNAATIKHYRGPSAKKTRIIDQRKRRLR
jgi:hypothetical protein